jgi:hypothetical protein
METKHIQDKTLEKLLFSNNWSSKGHFTSEEVDKTIQNFYKEVGTKRALKFSRYLASYVNDCKELDKIQLTLQDYGVIIYSSGIVGRKLKEQGSGLVMKFTAGSVLHALEGKISAKEYKTTIYEAEKELVDEYFANF